MTEKLYYKNAYIKDFCARVISCEPCDEGFKVLLDRTAFFPEEGGQRSDTGKIAGASVIRVFEECGSIFHITDSPVECEEASCSLSFDERFDKMQNHTAEHIISGIVHSLFGFDNVGFHLSDEEVVLDTSGALTDEQISEIERLANEAVFANIPVTSYFPEPEEISNLNYRAKMEIAENLRLVKIGEIDLCACCAPHVSHTGECGIIKILEYMKHRGGMRIWIAAGRRALSDYREKQSNIKKISAMMSVPRGDSAAAVERYVKTTEQIKHELKSAKQRLAASLADGVAPTDSSAVYLLEGLDKDDMNAFVNKASSKIGGILVALTGSDGDYKYLITSGSRDLRPIIKDANLHLSGRGGGKPEAVQGSFAATLDEIRKYFLKA